MFSTVQKSVVQTSCMLASSHKSQITNQIIKFANQSTPNFIRQLYKLNRTQELQNSVFKPVHPQPHSRIRVQFENPSSIASTIFTDNKFHCLACWDIQYVICAITIQVRANTSVTSEAWWYCVVVTECLSLYSLRSDYVYFLTSSVAFGNEWTMQSYISMI